MLGFYLLTGLFLTVCPTDIYFPFLICWSDELTLVATPALPAFWQVTCWHQGDSGA